MEDYKNIFKKICRICLNTSNEMVTLVDECSEDGLSAYGKAVMIFANVNVSICELIFFFCFTDLVLASSSPILPPPAYRSSSCSVPV